MFPLKSLRKPRSTPYITYTLIAINVLVFLWELSLSQAQLRGQFSALALIPCDIRREFFSLETLRDTFTSMFLHGGWLHLVGNMVFLAIFGPNIEDYLGKARYLFFYIVCGYAAGLVHVAFVSSCTPTIGASGAIYGVLGGFLLLYPATRIRTVTLFFRVPIGTANVQAFYMLGYYFIVQVINGIASLRVETSDAGGVAVWAHIGGFIAGLLLGFTFMLFRAPPPVDAFEHLGE